MCASFRVLNLQAHSKVNAWICALATDRDLESGLSKSISVGTRKMVNCASR